MSNLKTTVGGVVALVSVALLAFHRIDTQNALLLLGVAGGWIGIAGADAGKDAGKKD